MSYTVEYNPELRNSYPMEHKRRRRLPVKALGVALVVIIILYTLNSLGVLRMFIPGDPVVTAGAFSEMVEQVRSGQTVSEALFSFFQNVIEGGKRL